ncbi:MAG TPA: HAD-IA family hydrolase [Methylomirabilota bacterium]|jgi:putative hydrolase of the HAD superfamily|nr:HAD-IA family hydrolase [Methylomirabilota bacterium]
MRRLVLFDVAGTLLGVREGVGAQYAALARRFGVAAEPNLIDRLFPAAFRAAPPMVFPGVPPDAVPDRERAVWEGIVRRIFAEAGLVPDFGEARFAAYFGALYAHFATAAAWAVHLDVLPLLGTLRARGVRAGIVTNFDSRIEPLLAEVGLDSWFEAVTRSSAVGAAKPDPAIFRHALARHGVEAAEALHVGDSPTEDVAGAAAAGLLGVLVDRAGRHPDPPGGVRVASLAEVTRLL